MRLLTLPIRLPFKVLRGVVSLLQGSPEATTTPTQRPPQPRYRREPAAAAPPPPAPRNGGAPPAAEAEPAAEPMHVSEEPELVAEVAEQGAEEGAGPELHIEEPWSGYDRMNAADIRARLRSEGAAAATAVSLYEAANKGRSSVLEAASRALSGQPSG